jgi:xylulokinase
VVAALLIALEVLDTVTGSVLPDAPITLIGGGARGEAWREAVSRMSGRAIEIPDAQELVALGGAVQAAAVLAGEEPAEVAARWNLRAGTVIERRSRDDETLERFRSVLAATSQLNEGMVNR